MVTYLEVLDELHRLRIEKQKAQIKERQAFKRELMARLKIPFRVAYPTQPKQPTAIAIERKKKREEKARIAKQNRTAEIALFTKRQEEAALRILERMHTRND